MDFLKGLFTSRKYSSSRIVQSITCQCQSVILCKISTSLLMSNIFISEIIIVWAMYCNVLEDYQKASLSQYFIWNNRKCNSDIILCWNQIRRLPKWKTFTILYCIAWWNSPSSHFTTWWNTPSSCFEIEIQFIAVFCELRKREVDER